MPPQIIPGRIEAEYYNNGGEGVGYHDSTSGNQGGAGQRADDVDIKNVAGEGLTIGFTANGEWLAYTVNVQQSGNYSPSFRVANGSSANTALHLEENGTNISGPITILPTGSWSNQTTVVGNVISLAQGPHNLKVIFDAAPLDLNWMNFAAAAPPAPTWQNTSFALQTRLFQAEFDAVPNGSSLDVVIGLSNGVADAYTDLAAIVAFHAQGIIDVRNGPAYAATNAVSYSANQSYHFRMVVDPAARQYDVYVRAAGGNEVLLADDFAFRTEQAQLSQFNNLAIYASTGGAAVSNFSVVELQTAIATLSHSEISVQSSSQPGAQSALDNTSDTRWLIDQGFPAEIVLNLGGTYYVSGIRYLETWTPVHDYQIFVSTDSVNWGSAVASGTMPDASVGPEITFPSKVGSYLKFVYLNAGFGTSGYCYTAELNVLVSVPKLNYSNWTVCANEGETCGFSGTKYVRYGTDSFYFTSLATDGVACDNATFGDPAVTFGKRCEYRDVSSAPFGVYPALIPGTIQMEEFDLGGEGVAFHDIDGVNNGGSLRPNEGVDIEPAGGGGFNIGWTNPGETLNYTVYVTSSGTYTLTARVASTGPGNDFHIESDGVNVSGTLSIPNTGDWQIYTNVMSSVYLKAGVHVLKVVFDSTGSGYSGNIDSLRFSR